MSNGKQTELKTLFNFIFVLFTLIGLLSCDSNEPQTASTLSLTVEDVSCTEAWLQLKSSDIQLPKNISLLVNGAVKKTFTLSTQDSLLYIDSLLPNQSYKVLATMQQSKNASNELTFTTMDTTSHSFTWQTFTFGEHSSSSLYDVAIINENDIWAVGEIYMNDSLGNPDPICYNALHWNGQSWELIKTGGYGGYPRRTVFAFSADDVWFDGVIKWDGASYSVHMNGWPLMPNGDGWQVNKMWGSSSNDIYAVGANGKIAHYNGSGWTKIESETTTNINDVWGIINNKNETIIYCAVSSFFVSGDKKILKIVDGKVDSVIWGRDIRPYSAWTSNENFLYVCGEGVFVNKLGAWTEINLPSGGKNSLRGVDINDIFIDGDNGFVAHYNGSTWKIYNSNYLKGYSRLDFKGTIVAVVGNNQGKAIVEIGKRN